jgi:hypothetical protein
MVLSSFDSYAGSGRNYYMYDDPKSGQFMMLPWDVNMAFGQFPINANIITNSAFNPDNLNTRPLIKAIVSCDSLKNVYVSMLRALIAGPANADTVAAEVNRLKAIIEPAVKLEPDANRFYSYAQFIQNLEQDLEIPDGFSVKKIVGIKSFSVARNAAILQQIAAGVVPGITFERQRTSGLHVSCLYNERSSSVSINYGLPATVDASMAIFDGCGRVVERFTPDASHCTGNITWKTGNVPAGVYVVSLTNGSGSVSDRILIAK